MVSISSDPPIFGEGASALTSFSQQLNLEAASVTIRTTTANITAVITVVVDANSNQISVEGTTSTPVRFTVGLQSVHPPTNFSYAGGFGGNGPVSGPDVFESDPPTIEDTVTISHRNEDWDEPAAFNDTLTQQGRLPCLLIPPCLPWVPTTIL
jgi:hypothetical protein